MAETRERTEGETQFFIGFVSFILGWVSCYLVEQALRTGTSTSRPILRQPPAYETRSQQRRQPSYESTQRRQRTAETPPRQASGNMEYVYVEDEDEYEDTQTDSPPRQYLEGHANSQLEKHRGDRADSSPAGYLEGPARAQTASKYIKGN